MASQNTIEQARHLWAEKGSRPGRKPSLTRDEWLVIGEALAEGKAKSKGHPGGFKAWRKENGFGAMRGTEMADAIWLASEEGRQFSTIIVEKSLNHPVAIHAAYRAQKSVDLGMTHVTAILQAIKSGPKTVDEIAVATGLDTVQIRRRAAELERAGKIERADDKYGLLAVGRTIQEKVQIEADKKLAADLYRAARSLEDALENLCNNSKSADDARMRMAAALNDPWISLGVGVKEKVEAGKARRTRTRNIMPGMDGPSEGRFGHVRSLIQIEVVS
jgi:predicted transcriptional regulator